MLASDGLSHFLVDEDFDRAILKACADKDAKFLQTLPRDKLNAGSSEILNWVAAAGCGRAPRPELDATTCRATDTGRIGIGMSFATEPHQRRF